MSLEQLKWLLQAVNEGPFTNLGDADHKADCMKQIVREIREELAQEIAEEIAEE